MLSNPFRAFLRRLNPPSASRRVRGSSRRSASSIKASQRDRFSGFAAETLEERLLLSATPLAPKPTAGIFAEPTFIIEGRDSVSGNGGAKPATSGNQPIAPIDPAQMTAAYGVNQIMFGSVKGTGYRFRRGCVQFAIRPPTVQYRRRPHVSGPESNRHHVTRPGSQLHTGRMGRGGIAGRGMGALDRASSQHHSV
jgi:hypothetical protein